MATLGRAIQRQRRGNVWRTKRLKILPVESAQGGFDRGTKSRYAVADRSSEERDPDAGTDKEPGHSHGGRAAGMRFAIEFGALPGGDLIEFLCRHFTQNTFRLPALDIGAGPEEMVGKKLTGDWPIQNFRLSSTDDLTGCSGGCPQPHVLFEKTPRVRTPAATPETLRVRTETLRVRTPPLHRRYHARSMYTVSPW